MRQTPAMLEGGHRRNSRGTDGHDPLARGLREALGGHRKAEDTPGGGVTELVDLAAAPQARPVDVTCVVDR